MTTFGERLKELRQEKKLTLYESAKILGITSSTLSHYENDIRCPNCEFLKNCSYLFDVSADYLLGISPSKYVKGSSNYIKLSVTSEDLNKKSKNLINFLALYLSKYSEDLEDNDLELLKVYIGTQIKIFTQKNKGKSYIMQNKLANKNEETLA